MRNVAVLAVLMFFFLWDGLFNDGRHLDTTIRFFRWIFSYLGLPA